MLVLLAMLVFLLAVVFGVWLSPLFWLLLLVAVILALASQRARL